MDIQQNVSLRDYSTMRLGGMAAHLMEVHDKSQLQSALQWADSKDLPVIMIGTGSNIIWGDEGYRGLVLVNKIMGYESSEETDGVVITAGAGENWDGIVARTVSSGLTGIEALSLVPGTVGATPVQNVGAYGQEISDVLVSIDAYDHRAKKFVTIANADCGFSYRNSRFKTTDRGQFFITGLSMRLHRGNPEPPFYASVDAYFEEHDVHSYTPQVLRDAVVAIRTSKLPDPAVVANNGSFFANPVIKQAQLDELLASYPTISFWGLGDGNCKISAAWLVEQAGFKGAHDAETGMATWPVQALVFINEKARSTADLLKFRQKVTDKVYEMFKITLDQEPELISS